MNLKDKNNHREGKTTDTPKIPSKRHQLLKVTKQLEGVLKDSLIHSFNVI